MKKFYDKLILVLAFLALLGGVMFYMLKTEGAADQSSSLNMQPADNPYQPVAIPDSAIVQATWPEPVHQSSGPNWLYGVFTPPKIYIDSEGNFSAEPPKPVEPPKPFGIYLAEMERELYRIQMQGFSGDREKPEEAVLFIFDEERQLRFFIREGQSNEESQIEVIDFTIESEIDAEKGKASVTAIATILDKRTGKEVKLNDEEPLFSTDVSLIFRSEEDSGIEVSLTVDPKKPVTSFKTPLGDYVLQEINLEDRTVTVKKQATEESEAKIRTLSPTVFKQPKATEPKDEGEAPSATGDEFEFPF